MSDRPLTEALADAALAAVDLIAAAARGFWTSLEDYPELRSTIVAAAVASVVGFAAYWFYDGVKHWRRKCFWCKGRGTFTSNLSDKLNRPCKCCADSPAGGGHHITVRKRIATRLRGRRA